MVPMIKLILDGDGAWPDLEHRAVKQVSSMSMSVLKHGMSSGRPSVAIRLDLPGGDVVVAETSLRALLTTVDAIVARYGDPR